MLTLTSPAEREVRRRIAGQHLLEGKSISEVARIVKASKSSVKKWKDTLDQGGLDALKAKPHPGRAPRLSAAQKRRLVSVLLRGAPAAGYRTDLWTSRRVAEVIKRKFGVRYHPGHVWKILRGLNWTCQKPEQRARERDEVAIQRWRRKKWPRIKKREFKNKLASYFSMKAASCCNRCAVARGHPVARRRFNGRGIGTTGCLPSPPSRCRRCVVIRVCIFSCLSITSKRRT